MKLLSARGEQHRVGKGAGSINVVVDHLWSGVNYEAVLLRAYDRPEVFLRDACLIFRYSSERRNLALSGQTPDAAYFLILGQKGQHNDGQNFA